MQNGMMNIFFFQEKHFMQMNNGGEAYQHAGSLQLFKLRKATKYVKSKTERTINSHSVP